AGVRRVRGEKESSRLGTGRPVLTRRWAVRSSVASLGSSFWPVSTAVSRRVSSRRFGQNGATRFSAGLSWGKGAARMTASSGVGGEGLGAPALPDREHHAGDPRGGDRLGHDALVCADWVA